MRHFFGAMAIKKSIRWPNLYIIGAPKCGTTAMSHYLSGHPGLYMSEQAGIKEPWYFNTDLSMSWAIREKSSYLALFKNAPNDVPYWGEATAFYLYSKVALHNILDVSPNAQFIIMIRNPLEVVRSLYNQYNKGHQENTLNLKEAWRAQDLRLSGKCSLPPGNNEPKIYQYGLIAKMGSQIERARQLVDRDRMHIVIYDDFSQNPRLEYLKVLKFLGLEDDDRSDFPTLNRHVSYRYHSLHLILRRLSFIRKQLHIPGGWGINALVDRFNVIERRREDSIPIDLRTELIEYFKEDVDLLSDILQRDFSHWLV